MDASAYLKRHGWRGDGHSLDLTDRGIRKPLLVSKKVDVLGLGINKHAAVSDQWWMRAFDQGLKDLGTGKESALASVRKHGMHHGGLYGRFIKGEGVPGTIGSRGWISYTPSENHSVDPQTTPIDSGIDVDDDRDHGKGARKAGVSEPSGERKKKRSRLSTVKLANYQKRAKAKGITVDEYIKRREAKYAARKGSKRNQPP